MGLGAEQGGPLNKSDNPSAQEIPPHTHTYTCTSLLESSLLIRPSILLLDFSGLYSLRQREDPDCIPACTDQQARPRAWAETAAHLRQPRLLPYTDHTVC